MNDEGDVPTTPTTYITLKSIFIPIFRKILHITQGFVIMNQAKNQSNRCQFSVKRGAIKADCILTSGTYFDYIHVAKRLFA